MDITAASTERTIHIRICHRLWFRAFNMYIFKIPGFYECPISWVHFREIRRKWGKMQEFCSKRAIYRQIFTMSKNGKLEFQRFQTQLVKVRDCRAQYSIAT